MQKQKLRYPFEMAVFLSMYYVTNCMFQSYMSLFYTSISFTSSQIGIINAGVAVVSIFAQPVWGMCGDRAKDKRHVLLVLALCAAAISAAEKLTSAFAVLFPLACLFSIFYTSIQPMGDSVILRKLEDGRQPFGPIRLTACLTFALCSILFGRILDRGLQGWIPVFTAILCSMIAATILTLPKTPGGQNAGKRMSFGSLLKRKELVRLLLFILPMMICMGYFYTFYSPFFVSLPGGTSSLLGIAYFISASSEFPFLLFSDKLIDRYGAGKMMCVSALLLTVRFTILATTKSVIAALLSQLCHGGGFIVITVCASKYITRTVPDELQASGQMLLAMITFGIARTCGNLLGGPLADIIGMQNVFYIAAAICLITLCVFAPYYLRHKPLNGLDESEA